MKFIDKIKLRRMNRRIDKLEYEAYKRHKKYELDALDYILEECDRAKQNTEATINYFNSVFKNN